MVPAVRLLPMYCVLVNRLGIILLNVFVSVLRLQFVKSHFTFIVIL